MWHCCRNSDAVPDMGDLGAFLTQTIPAAGEQQQWMSCSALF